MSLPLHKIKSIISSGAIFRILATMCFIGLATAAVAQFNDTTNYFVRYNGTGTINRTNDQRSHVLNNALRFSLYKKNISLNSNTAWIYGKQQDRLTNNDITSTLDFDIYKSKRSIYYWGLLNFEKSYSLAIDHRFQGGLGIGYYFIDRDNFVLQVSDGILFESSRVEPRDEAPPVTSDDQILRNSFRLKFRYVFRDNVKIDHIDYLQHSLEDRSDYILRSSTIIAVKLYKWISLSLTVDYNKISVTERENLLLNYGITLEKYF
jgi:Protein of unknown function, DUF481.